MNKNKMSRPFSKKLTSGKGQNIFLKIITNSLLGGLLFIMTIPFFWMFFASFKTHKEAVQLPPTWIPQNPTLNNYLNLFETINFARPIYNSFVVAILTTSISLLICSMIAYAIAKFKFRGQKVLFIGILSTLMVPGQVTVIPVFIMLAKMGLLNTYTGLILPGLAAVGTIFFLRQFLITITDDFIEAARIDGASDIKIYTKVILPMMRPALITMGVFTFTASWNSFFWPLIIVNQERLNTLPLAMAALEGGNIEDYGLKMAGAMVVIVPLIIVFIFAQKYIMQSINLGGVKE